MTKFKIITRMTLRPYTPSESCILRVKTPVDSIGYELVTETSGDFDILNGTVYTRAHAEMLDNHFVLFFNGKIPFGVAETKEEADRRIYERMRSSTENTYKSRKHGKVEFIDETGKLKS